MVTEAHAEAQSSYWANSASPHGLGLEARRALQASKCSIGVAMGCHSSELLITSGATESNNLALVGVYMAEQLRRSPRRGVLVSAIEHPSVLETADSLKANGAVVERIKVNSQGQLDLTDLSSKLSQDTLLVSVMAANNEVGTLQPIEEVAQACHDFGAFFHSDATQWLGRLPLNVTKLGVDLLSASAHKLHGPKGVGLLFVRSGLSICEQQKGGGHQGGKRSGTVDVPGVVAFDKALQVAGDQPDWSQVESLRERLFEGLSRKAGPIERVSPSIGCLPNTLNLRFNGIDSEALMAAAPMICCSPGSACSHATPQPSHVLMAMGMDRRTASECLRLSLSKGTTVEEIDQAIELLSDAAGYVRSVLYERPNG